MSQHPAAGLRQQVRSLRARFSPSPYFLLRRSSYILPRTPSRVLPQQSHCFLLVGFRLHGADDKIRHDLDPACASPAASIPPSSVPTPTRFCLTRLKAPSSFPIREQARFKQPRHWIALGSDRDSPISAWKSRCFV